MDRRKATGWGAIVVGGIIDVVNYYPTTRSVVEGLKTSGGTGGVVADVLLNPLFGLVVIVVGLLLLRASKRDGGSMSDHNDAPKLPSDNDASASEHSAAAAGSGASANTNVNTFSPVINVNVPHAAPQSTGPTAGYGSTGAYVAAHPPEQREDA